jgi:hypothetical protein
MKLRVLSGNSADLEIEIRQGRQTIGSDLSCDIVLLDCEAGEQAAIERQSDELSIARFDGAQWSEPQTFAFDNELQVGGIRVCVQAPELVQAVVPQNDIDLALTSAKKISVAVSPPEPFSAFKSFITRLGQLKTRTVVTASVLAFGGLGAMGVAGGAFKDSPAVLPESAQWIQAAAANYGAAGVVVSGQGSDAISIRVRFLSEERRAAFSQWVSGRVNGRYKVDAFVDKGIAEVGKPLQMAKTTTEVASIDSFSKSLGCDSTCVDPGTIASLSSGQTPKVILKDGRTLFVGDQWSNGIVISEVGDDTIAFQKGEKSATLRLKI